MSSARKDERDSKDILKLLSTCTVRPSNLTVPCLIPVSDIDMNVVSQFPT